MANIFVILPGLALADLDAMTLAELADWHRRAIDRAPKSE